MRSTLVYSVLVMWLQLLGLFMPDAAAMEVADLQFTELNNRNGLSSTVVLDIAEDDKGYIWLATMNGLNRYSGYDIKQYHPSDIDPNALPSGFIQTLFVDSEGTLWIGTHSGLARYRPKTDDFEIYASEKTSIKFDLITTISEARNGDILFSDTKYLYSLSKTTGHIKIITQAFETTSNIKVIFDEASRIWIGSNDAGAKIFDKSDAQLFSLDKVNPWNINLPITALHDVKVIEGSYWLATNKGIYIINAHGKLINTIADSSLLPDRDINVLTLEKVNDKVWLGTDTGLFIVGGALDTPEDITLSNITHVDASTENVTGLSQSLIIKIEKDKSGGVWLGSLQGAFRYHKNYSEVKFHPSFSQGIRDAEAATIWGLAQNADGEIFFASQNRGIGLLHKVTGELSYLTKHPQAEEGTTFWDLAIDDNNIYWVATSDGLLAYRKNKDQLHLIHHFFKGKFVDYIHQDNDSVWVWLDGDGLYSIQTNNIDSVEFANRMQKRNIAPLPTFHLPIFTDRTNRVWLRHKDGVLLYDAKTDKVVQSLDKSNGINSLVYSVYETPDAFWLTTRSDGVIRLNKSTFSIEQKQIRDDSNGYIFSSVGVMDSIWYADSAGIHQIELPSLSETSTISNAQLEFNSLGESAILATANGNIYFGGNKGFNRIAKSSSNIIENIKTASPELFKFSVFGQPKFLLNKEISERDVSRHENITYDNKKNLQYYESRFSISFGLINSVYPREVAYRYRLNGLDSVWVYINNDRTAQFNNVPFGSYSFEVQAKESGKEWSKSRMLTLDISRPPWLHSIALVFYTLLALTMLVFFVRQYQLRKSNQLSIKESEERLKLTLWSSGDELWDWDVYRGQVYRANTWGTLDFPQDDIRTTGAYDANIHPNDINRVKDALRSHLEGKSEFYELAYRAKTFKNQWIWLLDRGKVVERDHNEQPVRMTGTLKNINHLKEAEEQLNLFKRSIENISEGVFITNTQFKFISVNNAYCKYTGETREQALATYMHFHLYPDAFTEEIKKTLKTKGNWSGEVESVRVNGERFEMELNIDAVHDDDGKISHFVGVFSDITSRKSTEKELLKLANTDPLTELPNRSFFQASHQNLVRKAVPHTLVCLDMDNFKKINDSLGHQTGDILIKQIAKRLQRITGKSATCYRLGGDEFSVLMEDSADIHTVTHYAQNLLDTLSRPFIINKQEFVLGASLGIAFFPNDGKTPQEMLKNADTAMYFAKNNGGNSYQFFSGEMNQNAVRQLQIENLIRQGIKDDLFTVFYQPKVDIASGKLVSMEALVRFEHPQKGIVSPGQFIPLAEQTGQIIEIGEQVLRKACADTKRWVNQGLFSGRVAVNISVKQFELPDLDDRINRILSEVGLSPLHLECEITEGTLMESPENGLRMMNRLRERGIHLALDDFGTGYSSLAYLKRFPLNTLKIDKAFIDDIANSSVDRHMAAAIISIAHNLGLKVVAEGVEDEQQLNILRRYDCEMLQGFIYSRPLNAERFEKLLTENQKLHNLLGQSNL